MVDKYHDSCALGDLRTLLDEFLVDIILSALANSWSYHNGGSIVLISTV